MEAILVVRTHQKQPIKHPRLLNQPSLDTSRCTLRRHLRNPLTLHPQRKTYPLWLDRLYAMYPRVNHHRTQWTSWTKRCYYRWIQGPFSITIVPRVWRRLRRRVVGNSAVPCTEVWKEQYAVLHCGMLVDWRVECQLHAGSWIVYFDVHSRGQSGTLMCFV